MRAAACLFTAAVSLPLPLPSTSAPTSTSCSHSHRRPATLLRCSPPRRHRLRGVAARALDERLLEAALAAAGVEETPGSVADGGEEAGMLVEAEEQPLPPAKAFVKSRRQRMQEEEDATAESDRFKVINGKELFSEYWRQTFVLRGSSSFYF